MEQKDELVLKNTFLELDTTSFRKRERACSDSALYEGYCSMVEAENWRWTTKTGTLEVDNEDSPTPRVAMHSQEVDFELTGLSDTDADLGKEGLHSRESTPRCPLQRQCFELKQEIEIPFTPSPTGEALLAFGDPPQEVGASLESKGAEDLEQLAAEVTRLAKENEQLRQSAQLGQDTAQSSLWGQSAPAWSFALPAVQFCMPATLAFHQDQDWGNPTQGQQDLPVPEEQGQRCSSEVQQETKRGCRRGAKAEHEEDPDTIAGCRTQVPGKQKARECKSGRSEAVPSETDCDLPAGQCTTVMLRNLPNNYTRDMVLQLLDDEGYRGKYNFLYLPIDFRSHACLGYAFINLVEPSLVPGFWEKFSGYCKWVLPSKKVCGVSWSGPHQGLTAHLERYRNSPVMHPSVPDEYKPLVFEDAVRVPFPEPTKLRRAPRIRKHDDHKAHWSAALCQKPTEGTLPANADCERRPLAVGAVASSS